MEDDVPVDDLFLNPSLELARAYCFALLAKS
jgi:hypothetical protein